MKLSRKWSKLRWEAEVNYEKGIASIITHLGLPAVDVSCRIGEFAADTMRFQLRSVYFRRNNRYRGYGINLLYNLYMYG